LFVLIAWRSWAGLFAGGRSAGGCALMMLVGAAITFAGKVAGGCLAERVGCWKVTVFSVVGSAALVFFCEPEWIVPWLVLLFIAQLATGPVLSLVYEKMETAASVLLVLNQEDETGVVVLDQTPFYGEGGGEVGDIGTIKGKRVTDTKKTADGKYYHFVEMAEGDIHVGEQVKACVSVCTRKRIQANHSATHLLDSALKNALGNAVTQSGSLVSADRLRFDFTLDRAVTAAELETIEAEVNSKILDGLTVSWEEMPIDEAKGRGAVAVFGNKYGETVRVVSMGDYSMELCGGCHVSNTSEIGLFKILGETGVAAGVRRIEAVTGMGVLAELKKAESTILKTAENLKCGVGDVAKKAAAVVMEIKTLESKIESLNAKLAGGAADEILAGAKEIGGITVVCGRVDGAGVDALRNIGDEFKAKTPCGVIVLASADGDKATFVAMATKEAIAKGAHSGNIVREVAKIAGGGGGGRPDSAQAGGKDVAKIDEALNAVYDLIEKISE